MMGGGGGVGCSAFGLVGGRGWCLLALEESDLLVVSDLSIELDRARHGGLFLRRRHEGEIKLDVRVCAFWLFSLDEKLCEFEVPFGACDAGGATTSGCTEELLDALLSRLFACGPCCGAFGSGFGASTACLALFGGVADFFGEVPALQACGAIFFALFSDGG